VRIEIKDYRNIETMELDIDDGKVNFIYGISGSGKSTLIKAVSSEPTDVDTPIGRSPAHPSALINGDVPVYTGTMVFDENSVKQLILEPIGNGLAYSAMIGNEAVLNQLELEFQQAIDDLRKHLPAMLTRRDQIKSLLDAFGERAPGSTFDKKAGISKLKKVLDKTKTGTAKIALSSNDKYISFIKDGMSINNDYSNHICPFCKRKLSSVSFRLF
jgi:DNA repair ATPase RecN